MLAPDASRHCKISKELHQDLTNCLHELNQIAPRSLISVTERVNNRLAQLRNGDQPVDLGIANRELRLLTKLIEVIELTSEILSGRVVSNEVEKKVGESNIGELVNSLRSLAQDSKLASLASYVTTELGQIGDRSLGALFRKHARELDQLSIDKPLEPLILPRPPTVSDSDFS